MQASRREFNGGRFERRQDDTAPSNTPAYSIIQNSTCVTAPEVTEGPYYVANELLRTDLHGDQAGVDLVLDIGVMDTTTCTPLDNALVEIWALLVLTRALRLLHSEFQMVRETHGSVADMQPTRRASSDLRPSIRDI
ncbi:hypothetical protein V565_224450, partial [Rhizoctonia solani 123E]